jgi:Spy/CpxP family protein refolding chaperone
MIYINHYLSKSRKVVMKKHLFSRIIVVGAAVVMMGIGMNAYAADKAPESAGVGTTSTKLTDEQIKQMETERNAFQTAAENLRQQITEKRRALNTELSKQTPDAATAMALQKSISDLQSQFDQKRLTHFFAMKKIDPNFTESRGTGRGKPYGMKPGMGRGTEPGMRPMPPGMPPGMGPGMGQGPSVAKPAN